MCSSRWFDESSVKIESVTLLPVTHTQSFGVASEDVVHDSPFQDAVAYFFVIAEPCELNWMRSVDNVVLEIYRQYIVVAFLVRIQGKRVVVKGATANRNVFQSEYPSITKMAAAELNQRMRTLVVRHVV